MSRLTPIKPGRSTDKKHSGRKRFSFRFYVQLTKLSGLISIGSPDKPSGVKPSAFCKPTLLRPSFPTSASAAVSGLPSCLPSGNVRLVRRTAAGGGQGKSHYASEWVVFTTALNQARLRNCQNLMVILTDSHLSTICPLGQTARAVRPG